MPEILSRKEAIARGANKYFTGKPCSKGHVSYRYTTSGTCEGCLRPTSALIRTASIALEGQVVDPRLEMINRRLAIQEKEAENERRRIAIKEQSLALKSEYDLERSERKSNREHRRFLKESMVDVNIYAAGENYHVAVNMVWMAALIHNPEIKKSDVITGRKKDIFYVMRCFPEDKLTLCDQTNALMPRFDAGKAREEAVASARAAERAEIDAVWPEIKP